ncbi:MAG: hypothetical protein WA056_11420 [Gallionella sp.]
MSSLLASQYAFADYVVYKGHYSCAQGRTSLTLKINLAQNNADAIFEFLTDKNIKGSFKMAGSFDKNSKTIELYGKDWIEQPGRFRVVDLKGVFGNNFSTLSGNIFTDGCSSFEVSRDGGTDKVVADKIRARERMYKRLACVTWNIRYSNNPLFKNADVVEYKVTANMLDHADDQCEVRIKSQKRISLMPGNPPYRNGEVMVMDCGDIAPCN